MKILVYGAGVMGTLYGGALHYSGQDVTLLARGKRLNDLSSSGIALHDVEAGDWMYFHVPTVDELDPKESFDLILVFVQAQCLPDVLSSLQSYPHPATIVIMSATATGYDRWLEHVGRERVVVGHAGAGGYIDNHVVHYKIASSRFQRTMIGEVDGSRSRRVRQIATMLKQAGFQTVICSDMLAWHRCHLAWVCPLSEALYVSGTGEGLARNLSLMQLLVCAMREGIRALRGLGVRVSPYELRLLEWLPESVLVRRIQRFARSRAFIELVERHARAAPEETHFLADEFRQFASSSSVDTPAMNELYRSAFLREHPMRVPHVA